MSTKGYIKNRSKKKDNLSDVLVSLKHDTEANIGELFISRETLKLSFKKDIGVFVRYDEGAGESNLPYKTYTALLLSQSGVSLPYTIYSENLTIGVTYRITHDGPIAGDFTNVGAPDNNNGTYFVATGTTPNSWGNYFLDYNSGAPIVKVLENTLDANIHFEYSAEGNYLAVADTALFDSPNAYVTISNPTFISDSRIHIIQAIPVFFNVVSITTFSGTSVSDNIIGIFSAPTIFEIRIYNDTII